MSHKYRPKIYRYFNQHPTHIKKNICICISRLIGEITIEIFANKKILYFAIKKLFYKITLQTKNVKVNDFRTNSYWNILVNFKV